MTVYDEIDPELIFLKNIPRLGCDIWNSFTEGHQLPSRKDLDPVKLPPEVLPHILLIDVIESPARRFRWRLIGTHITEILGRNSTGNYIDDVLMHEKYNSFREPLDWVIEHRKAVRVWGQTNHSDKNWVPFENFIGPLVDDDGSVNMILVVAMYGD